MKRQLGILLFVFLIGFSVYSQTGIIVKGRVVNKLTNKPVAYASVFIKAYSTGTYTNEQGLFMLKLPQSVLNDTVAISCIGYESLRMKLSELKSSKIRLSPKINMLDEIAIVASYQPRKILKKAYKMRRKNYPFGEPYCANAYYREYSNKNDTTVHMLEMTLFLKEQGINKDPYNKTKYQVDTVNSFYHYTNRYFWGNFELAGPLYYDGLDRPGRGTYKVDSVFFRNNEKYIAISFIHKRSDSISFNRYAQIIINGEVIEIEDNVNKKAESSYQYFWTEHFIVNLSDYAIVDYFSSDHLLGKPMRFALKINKFYNLVYEVHASYRKIGRKYYPKNFSVLEKKVFVKRDNIDAKLYDFTAYSEYRFTTIDTTCKREITRPFILGSRVSTFRKKYAEKIHQYPKKEIFNDKMKDIFLQKIHVKNILEKPKK